MGLISFFFKMSSTDFHLVYADHDGFDRGEKPPHDGHVWIWKQASKGKYKECYECGILACDHQWFLKIEPEASIPEYWQCVVCLTKKE